jgi:DNA-directed RNA polymerase specialized sigma24 family protein
MRPQIRTSLHAIPTGVHAPLAGPIPDRLLVERAARGQRHAMQQLRDRHAMSLYALAMDPTEAADVVDATFEALWCAAAQYVTERESAHARLAAMTRSRAVGVVRARDWPCRDSLSQA